MSALTSQYHCELIDGHEIEKPLPKRLHGLIQTFIAAWLLRQLAPRFDVMTELNVWCGNQRLVPDIVVALRTALYLNEDLADEPILAVEILSPGQSFTDILGKCQSLMQVAGAHACWIVDPAKRRAWNYRIGLSEIEPLTGHLLLGERTEGVFQIIERLPIAEVWAELDVRGL